MTTYDFTRRSRPVVIVPYQARWPDEYGRLAAHIGELAGDTLIRIDHIGSTAVPGLAAKDVIDIQITIEDLDRTGSLLDRLIAGGYRGRGLRYDFFLGMDETDLELRKFYLREPYGSRRIHIHVREASRFNQRYALLLRDYLRASVEARAAYELLKQRLARIFPESIDGYLFVKEPALHLIYHAACQWADQVAWQPEPKPSGQQVTQP